MKTDLHDPKNWHGVWTALITPFEGSATPLESRKICESSLKKLLESQSNQGLRGLIVAGSTGEGSLLEEHEYVRLLQLVKRHSSVELGLVASIGSMTTRETLRRAQLAIELGYDGFLLAPPPYIRPPQRLLKEHYKQLARLKKAICIYDIPGRAGVGLSDSLIEDLCLNDVETKNFCVAVKDATGKVDRAYRLTQVLGHRVAYLSGDDPTFLPFLRCGGHGIVSVATNVIPRLFSTVFESERKQEFQKADEHFGRCEQFLEALGCESNPIPIKTLAWKQGLIREAIFELPLGPLPSEALEKLDDVYEKLIKG